VDSSSRASVSVVEVVLITGVGFGARNVRIAVGGIAAEVLTASGHSAKFRVPFGVRPGVTTVTVTNPGGHIGSIAFQVLNRVPQANAGPDQTVFVTSTVRLDGSASSDSDGDELSFHWSFLSRPSGSNAVLTDASAVRPAFVVDLPGRYAIRLIVNDGFADSQPDTVLIDTQNSPPVANAGPDQTVAVGATVQLDGSGSSDVDHDPVRFRWSFISRPAGSHATLTDETAPGPVFVADLSGRYVVQLIVNDGIVDSRPDTVTIDTRNSRPIANAGSAQTVLVGATVQLDGRGSSDVDGDPLMLRWSFVSRPTGSAATLSDPTAVNPTFVADATGTYVVQLIVNDGAVDSEAATVVVTANPRPVNQPPVVSAGPDKTVTLPGTATLNGSASDDGLPFGSVLTIGWSKASGPGVVIFANPSALQTSASFSVAGDYVLRLTASDGQLSSSDEVAVTVNAVNQAPAVDAGPDQTIRLPNTATLNGTVSDDGFPSGSTLTIAWSTVSGLGTVTFASPNTMSTTATFSTSGQYVLRLTASDGALSSSADVRVTVNPASGGEGLPPDPATVAPPVNPTIATDIRTSTEFLYTGANPIQTGVVPGTIEAKRAAVLRGRALTRDGVPLPGVRMTIVGRSEFGQTLSRADGMFDMAVNGGGFLTVRYEKAGFLPAQRQINVPWQDFAFLPDVVLIQLDSQVTTVDLSASVSIQVARGNPVTDADGTRQATLFFNQGTTATMVMPDSSMQALTTLNVRATEYTVGSNGPAAMPAELPPMSAYTYAVELSADEAIAAGAKTVNFSRPVIQYVENFLGFPVGMAVPVGFLDRERSVGFYNRDTSAWIPSDNGRVIRITGVSGGLATVDSVGTRSLPPLVLSTAELQQLATLYPTGQTLWRVPITHFTPWDYNWPYGPPPDLRAPRGNPVAADEPPDEDCNSTGSIIQCESQALGEERPVTGTPFRLIYSSDRMRGRAHGLNIPLTEADIPASLRRIELEISVAGQRFAQSFFATPNQSYNFRWDGKDAYGRNVQGGTLATVRIGYVYGVVYQEPAQFAQSFAVLSGIPPMATTLRRTAGGGEITIWRESTHHLESRSLHARAGSVGGWSLSLHHDYDPRIEVLYKGDGTRRDAQVIGAAIRTVAGNGVAVFGGDNGPATQAGLNSPHGITVAPDGSLYFTDQFNHRVRRIAPNGVITTIAGNGIAGFSGDGNLATQARLNFPSGVAVAPDGSIYFADTNNSRIRRVGSDGIISTVAGNGGEDFSGDGGSATQARLFDPSAVAVAPEGSLYIADRFNGRIRRVGPDGIIRTVAGNGNFGHLGDGGPATQAQLGFVEDVAVGPDGSFYIADEDRVRRVTPDGIINTVYNLSVLVRDGVTVLPAAATRPAGVTVAPDGSLYIADHNWNVIRLTVDGISVRAAGKSTFAYSGDGGPAIQAGLVNTVAVAVAPDGSFYIADKFNHRIRRVGSPLPGFSDGAFGVASEDGDEFYVFSELRHAQTINAFTGAVRYRFSYDTNGRLTAVTDGDGNVTTIQRDPSGNPTGIVAPFGQRTTLAVDANSYLSRIVNPAGEAFQFSYTADGLLTSSVDPNGNISRYTYDMRGALVRADDAAGGFKTLTRTEISNGHALVALQTALGRTTTYTVERLSSGARKRTVTDPSGAHAEIVIGPDGSRRTTDRDGTVTSLVFGPDPRWGMQAPVVSSLTVTTPAGLTRTVTGTRTATLANPSDPLSVLTQIETIAINGRTFTRRYDAATRTLTETSPEGRTRMMMLDAKGRVIQEQVNGREPTTYTYDARGRLSVVREGAGSAVRTSTLAYGSDGFLASLTDPLGRVTSFTRDAAGRPISRATPDGQTVAFSYDAGGKLASLTPPGRSAHSFSYTAVNLMSNYAPPNVGSGNTSTGYAYDSDRELTRVLRPDGQSVDLTYDSFGRLSTQADARGALGYTYDAAGRLAGLTAPGGLGLARSYDGFLLTGESASGAVTGTIARSYDTAFRLTSQGLNGSAVTFAYDDDDLLTRAGALNLTRSPQHGLVTATSLGTVTTSRAYTSFAELSRLSTSAGATLLYDAQYTRDSLGRITEKVEAAGGVTDSFAYIYDPAGRLVEVGKNSALAESYTYDANGNRTSVTAAGATRNAVYDAQDRLTQDGSTIYTYTANGELTSKTAGGQTTTYSYDALGNLTTVRLPNGAQIDYLIDGRNRRVGKKMNGVQVQSFLYAGNLGPIAELDASNNVVSRFVYAESNNVPAHMIKNGTTYRLIADDLGSVRLVVHTSTGTVVQRIDYDPWGNVVNDTNPGFQSFGFAGGLYDADTKLVRFGARDYDAETGRWTAKDPIGFVGGDANLYAYVSNDPVNDADSDGLKGKTVNKKKTSSKKASKPAGACKAPNLEVGFGPIEFLDEPLEVWVGDIEFLDQPPKVGVGDIEILESDGKPTSAEAFKSSAAGIKG